MSDEKLKFELVCPEGMVLAADVTDVVVPGSNGYFMVLPNHAPFLSTLRPGILRISGLNGIETRDYYVRDGLADVSPAGLTVLAQIAENASSMPKDLLDQEIARMKNEIEQLNDAVLSDAKQTELSYISQTRDELQGQ